MKAKRILYMLVAVLVMMAVGVGCNSNEEDNYAGKEMDELAGVWINYERKDTIDFVLVERNPSDSKISGLLVHKTPVPYYKEYSVGYVYVVFQDSITLFPAYSSYLYDWKNYKFHYDGNEVALYGFNNIEKSVYKRTK